MSGFDDDAYPAARRRTGGGDREGPTSPEVGRDEWVARHEERRVRLPGPLGALEQRLRRVPWWAWLTYSSGFRVLPVGVTTAIGAGWRSTPSSS